MTAISSVHYAKAFRRALQEGAVKEEELIGNLFRVIQHRGHAAHAKRIVECVSRELVHHHSGRWIIAETARPLTDAQREKVRGAFSKKDYMEEKVRSELVAGIRIVMDGEREFDGSLKRKLDILCLTN